jgi:DNA processing protein
LGVGAGAFDGERVALVASLRARPYTSGDLAAAARDLASWRVAGIGVHTVLDDSYPDRLRDLAAVPPVLFTRGIVRSDDHAVAIVGSRHASSRGLAFAADLSTALVGLGVTVVSGLAAGIDTAAHAAALASGGRTVAVLGTGVDRCYPPSNRDLQTELARRGLLLSQFWPDTPPREHNFVARNATLCGYADACVIAEAGESSSTRTFARQALDQSRPLILTNLVVQAADWAKSLTRRPGVAVASTVDEVLAAIAEISIT